MGNQILCRRCGAQSTNIWRHWANKHGGVPRAKVRTWVEETMPKRIRVRDDAGRTYVLEREGG